MDDLRRDRLAGAGLPQLTAAPSGIVRRGARAALAYLVALQFLYSWAWSSSDVLRPLFRQLYSLSLAEAGSAYSAQVTGALVGALWIGKVEHRLGRRNALALIGIGCGLAMAAGAAVDGLAGLIAQRLLLGLFMGAVFPVTIGVIADLFPASRRGRLASLIDGTYFAAIVVLGWAGAALMQADWRLLFWPIGLLFMMLGAGARLLPIADHHGGRPGSAPRLAGLFAPALRRRTAALAAMIAVNACSHQAFSGWITVYLVEVERVTEAAVAATLTAQYSGAVLGCAAWGVLVDRFGRRAGGFGMAASALFCLLFLAAGPLALKQLAAFGFGLSFAAVVTIGPWLAELYPPALRAPATSIFQWGRFASLVAPPISGALAAIVGLPAVMACAGAGLMLSAWIWRRLPETVPRRDLGGVR